MARPRPIVRVARSRSPTWTTASWLRYSTAPNHQAFPRTMGPPTAAEYCWREKGGASPVERS